MKSSIRINRQPGHQRFKVGLGRRAKPGHLEASMRRAARPSADAVGIWTGRGGRP